MDVGAGESPWRELLSHDADYYGLDVEHSDSFKMSKVRSGIIYYEGTIFPFPSETFSSAICIETLEHVSNPVKMLLEIFRVLELGGRVLISVPWSARRHHKPFDFYRYSPDGLKHLLTEAGFTEVQISPRGSEAHVIANKILIYVISIFKSKKNQWYALKLLFNALIIPLLVFWYVVAWINQICNIKSEIDPLGYFVKAKKT